MARKKTVASKGKQATALDASMRLVVLHGKEAMLQRIRTTQLKAALEAEHGEIETFTFDGETATLAEVFDELRGYSLMTTFKLVVIDAADAFVKTHREALMRYAGGPVDHATLLLRTGVWHRGNLDKLITPIGAILKCDAPSPAEATRWLIKRTEAEHGRTITRSAAQMLVDRLGPKLSALDAEAAKLAVMVGDGQPIDDKLVREVVGKGSDEQAWAVQEAILRAMGRRASEPGRGGAGRGGAGRGGAGLAIEVIHELIDLSGQPDILVMYFVADLGRKLATAQALKRQGVSEGVIAKDLKLWGTRQTMFMNVLRTLAPGQANRLLTQALTADTRSKSGFGTARRNLEGLCVTLTDNP